MRAKWTVGLSTWLAFLVLGTVVPLLLFAGATLFQISKDSLAARDQGQIDTARALALAVDGEVRSWKTALMALAASHSLQQGRLAEFYEEAQRVALQYQGWIVLTDATRKHLLNTLHLHGDPLPTETSPETFDTILTEGKPMVSDIFFGQVSQRFLVAVGVPVFRDGKAIYAMYLTFTPDHLTQIFNRQQLPASWVGAIYDRQPRVVTRSRDAEAMVGKPMVKWLVPATHAADVGTMTGPLPDGRLGQVAFQRLKEVPWVVILAIPVAELPSTTPLVHFLIVGAVMGCAAVGLALYIGRKVTAPIACLAGAGGPLVRGEAVEIGAQSGIREVRELQQALGEASAAVQGYYQERERTAIAVETAKVATAAEQALRASEERLQLFIRNAPAAIAMFDRDMRYLAVSRRWMTDYDLGDRDIVGHFHYEVFPQTPDYWKTVQQRGLAGEVVQATEDRFERMDGSVRWLRWEVRPWHTGEGAVGGIILFTEDITERKRADEALREAHDELEQRVQERTAELSRAIQTLETQSAQLRSLASELTLAEQRERQRLATVLHDEHQQLLVGVKLRVSPLERAEDPRVREASREITALLEEAIEHARSLTRDLSPPILTAGGLLPALDWLAHWMEEKHHLKVDLRLDETAVPDAEDLTILLFQSVRELLFNVVKHAKVATARVEMARRDGQVEILVTDTGVGFDPAFLRVEGGVVGGFGLFSIRQRMELLGGRLEIESTPGQGSRFTLRAPLQPARVVVLPVPAQVDTPMSAGVAAGAASARVRTGKIRILVVDDHKVVRQGLAKLLKAEPDMEVVGEAADGQMAVALTRQLLPDVVTMDISMPRMNGIEATRVIHAELPNVRVIGLSMFEETQQAVAMRNAGAVYYLTKSDASDVLVAAIRTWADPRRESQGDEAPSN